MAIVSKVVVELESVGVISIGPPGALVMATIADGVGLILLYAGLAKLSDLIGFRIVLLGYGALPRKLVPSIAISTPICEVALGAALLTAPTRSIAALAASVFFALVALTIGISLLLGQVPRLCGCLSTRSGDPPNHRTVLRLVVIVFGLLLVAPSTEVWSDWQSGFATPLILAVEVILAWFIAARIVRIVRKSNRMAHVISRAEAERMVVEPPPMDTSNASQIGGAN